MPPSKISSSNFWGITAFFNPLRYKTKIGNFKKFRERSAVQGLKLLAVELAFGDAPFELTNKDADLLIQIRTAATNILWQKERLLNIALQHLPADCSKVAWIDCDVLFDDDQWISRASDALDQYNVVQLFSTVVFMEQNKKNHSSSEQKRHGFVYTHLNGFEHSGHAGFAWAAQRKVIAAAGFYDRAILGSGDTIFRDACYGIETMSLLVFWTERLKISQRIWSRKMHLAVDNSIGCIHGSIFHLWHGEIENRQYRSRQSVLKEHDFDPDADVRIEDSGALVWATEKPLLHKAAADYFARRNEDE